MAPEYISGLVVGDNVDISPDVVRILAVGWALSSVSIVSLLLALAAAGLWWRGLSTGDTVLLMHNPASVPAGGPASEAGRRRLDDQVVRAVQPQERRRPPAGRPRRFPDGYRRGPATIFLIGPDGVVICKVLDPKKVENAVAKALLEIQ